MVKILIDDNVFITIRQCISKSAEAYDSTGICNWRCKHDVPIPVFSVVNAFNKLDTVNGDEKNIIRIKVVNWNGNDSLIA